MTLPVLLNTTVYRQSFDEPLVERGMLTVAIGLDLQRDGAARMKCADGCVRGKYQYPDGSWHEHVECKETGLMWVNLW